MMFRGGEGNRGAREFMRWVLFILDDKAQRIGVIGHKEETSGAHGHHQPMMVANQLWVEEDERESEIMIVEEIKVGSN